MTALRKKRRFRISFEQRNALRGLGFILPWLIGFLVFYLGCLIQLGRFSLRTISIDAATGLKVETFVGFANFIEAFTAHASFNQVLTSSVIDMLIDLPMIIFFSLFVALLLNRRFRGRSLVRADAGRPGPLRLSGQCEYPVIGCMAVGFRRRGEPGCKSATNWATILADVQA